MVLIPLLEEHGLAYSFVGRVGPIILPNMMLFRIIRVRVPPKVTMQN
jgi:hypothetical protein